MMGAALACVVYVNSLDLQFCFDDHSAIKENADLRLDVPWSNLLWDDFWGMPMHVEGSHKSYRPLCVLTFRLNYLLHQLEPLGCHLSNILLHALVTCLYVKLCRDVFECGEKTALVARVLFAVHPSTLRRWAAVRNVLSYSTYTSAQTHFLIVSLVHCQTICALLKLMYRYRCLSIVIISVLLTCTVLNSYRAKESKYFGWVATPYILM